MTLPIDLESLAVNPQLVRQFQLLQRLQTVLADDVRCFGAAAVGSLADGRADDKSDVDLLVYCEQGHATDILRHLSEAAADRPVINRLAGHHDTASVFEKVILADWSSYEIHVIEPTTRMRLRPPYVEVIDRDGYLSSRVSMDKPIGREHGRVYANGDPGLVWELFNCMKWLRRGDLGHAHQYLQALGQRLAETERQDIPAHLACASKPMVGSPDA